MIFLSRMIGIDATKVLQKQLNLPATNLAPAGINPLGPINGSTFGGVVLLVVDGIIHHFIGSKYGYKYIRPSITGIAGGLIGGGIIGGLFDDPVDSGGLSRNPIISMQGVNQTSLRTQVLI